MRAVRAKRREPSTDRSLTAGSNFDRTHPTRTQNPKPWDPERYASKGRSPPLVPLPPFALACLPSTEPLLSPRSPEFCVVVARRNRRIWAAAWPMPFSFSPMLFANQNQSNRPINGKESIEWLGSRSTHGIENATPRSKSHSFCVLVRACLLLSFFCPVFCRLACYLRLSSPLLCSSPRPSVAPNIHPPLCRF